MSSPLLARGRQPILAGPWLSEVGFEVLYWIPFLRWFEDRYRIDRERVIAVSRGRCRRAGTAMSQADTSISSITSIPRRSAARNAERRASGESGGQKQTRSAALRRRDSARRSSGVSGSTSAAVCHPALMYRLFNQFWFGNRALDLVISHTRHLPLDAWRVRARTWRCPSDTSPQSSTRARRCRTPPSTGARFVSSCGSDLPRACRSSCSTPA